MMKISSAKSLYGDIIEGFVELNPEKVVRSVKEGLNIGLDALSIHENGLRKGMDNLGELFEESKVFIPHLMLGAKVFAEAVEILKPHMIKEEATPRLGTAIIGTVFGDLHDLGKNLVALMWSISGFEVIDLGANVSVESFIKAAEEKKPKIVGLSSLLTTTMLQQREVIKALTRAGLRDKVKVLIGGAPTSERWASEIGADGYAEDVAESVRVAKSVIGV